MRSAKDSGIEPLIVALGDRHYEVNRPWAADHVTQDRVAGWRSDVATDSADRLYVFNRFDRYSDPAGLPVVTVYERTGQLARTLELPDVADGHGISIGPSDEIVLVDRDRHVVLILANDGTPKLILGERDKPGRPFSHPTAAKIGPGGDIFVTDGYGNSHVHRFSSTGKLIRSWGIPGTGPGEFSTCRRPHDPGRRRANHRTAFRLRTAAGLGSSGNVSGRDGHHEDAHSVWHSDLLLQMGAGWAR